DLPCGDYRLGFGNLPAGMSVTSQDSGSDIADSDADPSTGVTAVFTLGAVGIEAAMTTPDPGLDGTITAPGIDRTRDAGLTGTSYAIGDYVWRDLDRNGSQGAGEFGIDGVTAQLDRADGSAVRTLGGTTVTTVTAVGPGPRAGHYVFDALPPATYRVAFSSLPSGYTLTSQNTGADDTKDSDADPSTGLTAGYVLGAGTTSPVVPGTDGGLGATAIDRTADAGLLAPSYAIGDYVWLDVDGDGIQDPGESGVNGVAVTVSDNFGDPVLDGAGNPVTTTTATGPDGRTGHYVLDGLAAGAYDLQIGSPDCTVRDGGGDDSADSDADATTCRTGDVIVGPAAPDMAAANPAVDGTLDAATINRTVDVGITGDSYAIGNDVWRDLDRDGTQDPGEPGVNGVTVTLHHADGTPVLGSTGVALSTTTADGPGARPGFYLFDGLPAGGYRVKFQNFPGGSALTTANTGADDTKDSDPATGTGLTATVTIGAGMSVPDPALDGTIAAASVNRTVDAGLTAPTCAVGDYVWLDRDADGTQDPSELGINGVTLQLRDSAGSPAVDANGDPVTATTHTGPDGRAGFYVLDTLVCGDYQIAFDGLPAGLAITTRDSGGDDTADSDADTGTGRTAVFTLSLAGPSMSTPDPATDGTLDAAAINRTVDLGLAGPCYAIGNYVWRDLDHNGIQGPGEHGVNGATVSLLDPSGTALTSTDGSAVSTTTADGPSGAGYYALDCLPQGTYRVKFGPLGAGLSLTTANAGMSDTSDSDANATTGITGTVAIGAPGVVSGMSAISLSADGSLHAAAINRSIDAGILGPRYAIGSYVWLDTNGNGVQNSGELGVNGVVVRLLDGAGDPVTDSTGDPVITFTMTGPDGAMGFYLFDGLAPGTYVVEFVGLPPGYGITIPDSGGDDGADSDADDSTGRTGPIVVGPAAPNMSPPDPDIDGTVTAAEVNRTIALGLTGPCMGIGNLVWEDANANGRQDSGETGINGIQLSLWSFDGEAVLDPDGDQYTATTHTGPGGKAGYYLFDCLPAGGYVVVAELPGGTRLTTVDASGVADTGDSDFGDDGGGEADSGLVVLDPAEPTVTTVDSNVDGPIGSALIDRTVDAGFVVLDAPGPNPPSGNHGSPGHHGSTDGGTANAGSNGQAGPGSVPATGEPLLAVLRNGLLFLLAGTVLIGASLLAFGPRLRRRRS
ncbi:MAG: large repetitive protein, partial [Cryptosporangiaceae bacterium]|nr:large repetitive protein [Cryptosporangiaceae bacterium]